MTLRKIVEQGVYIITTKERITLKRTFIKRMGLHTAHEQRRPCLWLLVLRLFTAKRQINQSPLPFIFRLPNMHYFTQRKIIAATLRGVKLG